MPTKTAAVDEQWLAEAQLHEIHDVIVRDWTKPYFGAVPYLRAMRYLGSMTDRYGADEGEAIVAYFVSNAATWRGPTAKLVKAELRARLRARAARR